MKNCEYCFTPFEGRLNQKFHSNKCRGRHHYINKQDERLALKPVIEILRTNRNLLKENYGSKPVLLEELKKMGFKSAYITHSCASDDGVVKCCFDYGYVSQNSFIKIIKL